MRFKQFSKRMEKNIFTIEEAQIVAFNTAPKTLKLQLHQWVRAGDLVNLKRGLYAFADRPVDKIEVARYLYQPSYVSLEYALNAYGLIPDVPFAMTLVTPKATRKFDTPYGQFVYRKIKQEAFFGFDPATLMAEKEKALVDWLYLNGRRFLPRVDFWREMRLQNLKEIDFDKAAFFAERFGSSQLNKLLRSAEEYASLDRSS